MSSLDLSKFKKVAEDGKVSVLKHQDGHELKIAHSGLSPKMRTELKKLPLYQAEGPAPLDDNSPEAAADASRPADDSGIPSDDNSDNQTPAQVLAQDNPPPAVADDATTPSDDNSDSQTQAEVFRQDYPKPENPPVAGEVTVTAPPKAYMPTVQELDNEDATAAQDYGRGYIRPETFADKWARKDTPQKLMTIFGLMMSGAGSGLAHQKNAALEMIQNEINNDLAAQQNSNANAQNWLKLSHEYHLQKAQIGQIGAQTSLTGEQQKLTAQQTQESQASQALKLAQIKALATATAQNMMILDYLRKQMDANNKLPEAAQGPANALLNNVIIPAAQAKMHQNNVEGVAKQTLINSMAPKVQQPAAPSPAMPQAATEAVNSKELERLTNIGKIDPRLGLSPAQAAQAAVEKGRVEKNRVLYRSWLDSFRQLQKEFANGVLNEQKRAALVNVLGAEIARSATHSYNQNEAHAAADGMFPTYKDRFGSADTKIQKGAEFFKNEEADTPILDMKKLKTPFPSPYEGVKLQDKKTGKMKRMVNGKLVDIP